MSFVPQQKQTITVKRLSLVAKLSQDEQIRYLDKIDIAHMNAVDTLKLKDNIEAVQECEFKNRVKRGIKANIEWLRQQTGWTQTLIKHKFKSNLNRTLQFFKWTLNMSTSCFQKKVYSQKAARYDDEQLQRLNTSQQPSTKKLD